MHLNKMVYSIKLNIVSNYPGFWKISPMINEFIQLIHVNRKSILMQSLPSIFTIYFYHFLSMNLTVLEVSVFEVVDGVSEEPAGPVDDVDGGGDGGC